MTLSNTIIHGDCVQALAQLDPASVDLVLTDPPYLVNYRSRDGRSVINDANSDWLRPAFARIHRVLKPAAFCVSFYGWNRIHLFMDAWRTAGFRPVGHFVFRKRYGSSFGNFLVQKISGERERQSRSLGWEAGLAATGPLPSVGPSSA